MLNITSFEESKKSKYICCLCTKVSLYIWQSEGYCSDHREDLIIKRLKNQNKLLSKKIPRENLVSEREQERSSISRFNKDLYKKSDGRKTSI